MKSTAKKSTVSTKVPAAKPTVHAWRNRRAKPWTSFCDVRAVVAVVLRLHEVNKQSWFSLEDLITFASEADYGCLPYLRRADILEAFSDRHDLSASVSIIVNFLVTEGVLIAEYEPDGDMYRIDRDELRVLDEFHADIHRFVAKSTGLRVVP